MPAGKKRTIKKVTLRKPPPIDKDGETSEFNPMSIQKRVRDRRDEFCRQYIKDFNGANAIRRMGSKSKTPWVRASEYMAEPYTQWKLRQLLEKADEKAIVTRNDIMFGLLREMNYHGPDGGASARISALRTAGRFLGMEITKIEGNMSLNGGVMTVPFAQNVDQWGEAAKSQQEKLKQDVRK